MQVAFAIDYIYTVICHSGAGFSRLQPASRLEGRPCLHAGGFSTLLGWAFRPRNFMKNGGACFSLPACRGPATPPPVVFRPCHIAQLYPARCYTSIQSEALMNRRHFLGAGMARSEGRRGG